MKAELARNGLTQGELADRLRLTQPAVSRRLSGDVPFNVNELAVVSRVVGVPLSRLVAGSERPLVPVPA
ncbi:helix-turn-helix transcriptional regulator [Frigoribacterium sp. PhB160]|uniref:helix-turn-helix domain-containing protein n=1 Tax=Frigoribacterium sp. PhB160 TaxID=2485192 RepID=UPI001315260D|nr:helix-turn-helix transcriptional regulator [Frigoribacterium sp. PhB160]